MQNSLSRKADGNFEILWKPSVCESQSLCIVFRSACRHKVNAKPCLLRLLPLSSSSTSGYLTWDKSFTAHEVRNDAEEKQQPCWKRVHQVLSFSYEENKHNSLVALTVPQGLMRDYKGRGAAFLHFQARALRNDFNHLWFGVRGKTPGSTRK